MEVARSGWWFGEESVVSMRRAGVELKRWCNQRGADAGFRRQDLRETRERDW